LSADIIRFLFNVTAGVYEEVPPYGVVLKAPAVIARFITEHILSRKTPQANLRYFSWWALEDSNL
jgi:hypothetical protein